MSAASVSIVLLFAAVGAGVDWPNNDGELDAFLRQHSPKYKAMAESVQARQPFRIAASDDSHLGNVRSEGVGLVIEINSKVPRDRRATILIWEMANAFQRDKFDEIHRRALTGEIATKREYGLRMEMVEHGSHQLHFDVLQELSRHGIPISENFLYLVNPTLRTLHEYRIPSAHDYLGTNAKSGHTRHYEDWFDKIPRKDVGKTQ